LHEVVATHLVEDDDHREFRFRRWIRGAGEGDRECKQRNGNPSTAHHGAPNGGIMSRYSGSPGRGRANGSNSCEFRKFMSDKNRSYDRLPAISPSVIEWRTMSETRMIVVAVLSLFLQTTARPAHAQEPAEVVLLVNRKMPESAAVAEHYRMKRGVPAGNVILLGLPATQELSRQDYHGKKGAPLCPCPQDRQIKIQVFLL